MNPLNNTIWQRQRRPLFAKRYGARFEKSWLTIWGTLFTHGGCNLPFKARKAKTPVWWRGPQVMTIWGMMPTRKYRAKHGKDERVPLYAMTIWGALPLWKGAMCCSYPTVDLNWSKGGPNSKKRRNEWHEALCQLFQR